MVKSYTALRTHISQQYGRKATKVPDKGLLVLMPRSEVTEEDKLCYGCLPSSKNGIEGVLFTLDQLNIPCTSFRPFPYTLANFQFRCLKMGVEIVSQTDAIDTTPQEIAQKLGLDVVVHSPNIGYANYRVIDINISDININSHAILLSQSTYIRSEKHEGRYKVLFRLGKAREVKAEAGDVADLVELLCSVADEAKAAEDPRKWKGFSLKEIVGLVKLGMVETLFTNQETPKDWEW